MAWTDGAGSTHSGKLSIGRYARNLVSLVALWYGRATQRRALRQLDGRLLCDIGVGRIDAEIEARKAFWRP